MKLRMQRHEGIVIFMVVMMLVRDGRDTDIVECVDGVDLEFQLLQCTVVIFCAMFIAVLVGIGNVPLDSPWRPTVHPFCWVKIIL
jgi:hypothetical protein